jgi:hypothetical protein
VPLTNLTRKANAWDWTGRCQDAFELLKQKLTEAPLLCTPDERLPYEVVTDASDLAQCYCKKVILWLSSPGSEFGRAELQCYGEGNACSCARSPCVAMLSGRC